MLYTFENLGRFASLRHGVTTKRSDRSYHFSMALHTGEATEAIVDNREAMVSAFGEAWAFVLADQTHSDHIHIVREPTTRGWHSQKDAIADCDALITDQKGVMLGILTADCVPVLLYDPTHEVVAAIHAGWRGTEAQIVQKCVAKMVEVFGTKPEDIVAGIAPAIGACCYEVGQEVAAYFAKTPEVLTLQEDGRYRLDLPQANRGQLLDMGLKESHIEMSNLCTACHTEAFFSYRKEQGCTGRFMTLIGMIGDLGDR